MVGGVGCRGVILTVDAGSAHTRDADCRHPNGEMEECV